MTHYIGALGLIIVGALIGRALSKHHYARLAHNYETTIISCTAALHAFHAANNRLPGNIHELTDALATYYNRCITNKERPKLPF